MRTTIIHSREHPAEQNRLHILFSNTLLSFKNLFDLILLFNCLRAHHHALVGQAFEPGAAVRDPRPDLHGGFAGASGGNGLLAKMITGGGLYVIQGKERAISLRRQRDAANRTTVRVTVILTVCLTVLVLMRVLVTVLAWRGCSACVPTVSWWQSAAKDAGVPPSPPIRLCPRQVPTWPDCPLTTRISARAPTRDSRTTSAAKARSKIWLNFIFVCAVGGCRQV